MSPREHTAQALADTCQLGGLTDAYGVSVTRSTEGDKTFWSVTFCKAHLLDGVIRVYSPRFILVKWRTQLQNVPHKGSARFGNEGGAKRFVTEKFIQPTI